ncbi:MAG: asparagine synthase-related protein [Phycisphaerae bacterium]|jgi:asparagine synthase (glutamine-hydrolysing)
MNNVKVYTRKELDWRTVGGAHARGGAFWIDGAQEAVNLPEVFAATNSVDDFVATVRRLNGFHTIIVERDSEVWAAVDHTRSCLLFYGQRDGQLFLSDDAEWVRANVGDEEFDDFTATEFTLTSYVTGPDTLYPNVKQLQAGDVLVLSPGEGKVAVRIVPYYRRPYDSPIAIEEPELQQMHLEILERAMRRMFSWANGRMLCIPLSGGLDSRLIALMVKRLGYDRVMAFSYGKPGNAESEVSRHIAETLGIPWHFVPYSNEAWRRWYHSPECKEYYRFVDRMSAVHHPQDWPAVWEMKRGGVVPDDAVFVPGHAAASTFRWLRHEGSSLKYGFGGPRQRVRGEEVLTRTIFRSHYRLADWNPRKGDLGGRLADRIMRCSEATSLETLEEVERAIGTWYWRERHTKFIVNSVRVYEFWGYGWWLPLIDRELLDFWTRVPVVFRLFNPERKPVYDRQVREMWAALPGVAETPTPEMQPSLAHRVVRWIRGHGLHVIPLYRTMCKVLGRRSLYDSHPLAYYGIMTRSQFQEFYNGRNTLFYFLVMERLGRIAFRATDDPA